MQERIKKMQPNEFYRVSIFNQIYHSKYYHVQGYSKNLKTGKFTPDGPCYGHRGPGGHLGMTWLAAVEFAKELNRNLGWLQESDKTNLYFNLFC